MNAHTVRRAFGYLKPYAWGVVAGQTATLIAAAAGLAFPLVTRQLVDSIFGLDEISRLYPVLGILGGVSVVMMAAGYVRDVKLGRISQYITRDLRQQLFERLLILRVSYYETRSSGDVVSVMTNDINRFQDAISQGFVYVVTQVLSLIAVVVLLVRLDPVLTAVLAAPLPLVLFLAGTMGRRSREAARSVQRRLGSVTSFLTEAIRGIDVIKTFVLRRPALGMFHEENRAVTDDSVTVVRIKSLGSLLVGAIGALFLLTIIGVGARHVLAGRISVGDLIAYVILVQMILTPLGTLSGIWIEIQKAFAAAERIFALLDGEVEHASSRDGTTVARPGFAIPDDAHGARTSGDAMIAFRGVSFGYREETPILSNVDFSVARGETVALVGPSGAGKSSLIKLMLRFYEPDRGHIELEGAPLPLLDHDELRGRIGVVMQETHLFDMSVRENLMCGSPEASDADVRDAARRAGADDFIAALPQGYDTRIGENGVTLSGGQRQRIAIARAFLKNPPILLLDEATSSLDAESERVVRRALRKLMRGRTTVIISHRRSTIRDADRVYVVDDGMVFAETG